MEYTGRLADALAMAGKRAGVNVRELEGIRLFIYAQTTLALATASEDFVPRNTPLFYLADCDLNLYWFSARSSAHSRHCACNPNVSVAVHSAARTWKEIRGVQMTGRVSIVRDRKLRRSMGIAFTDRFQLDEAIGVAIRRCALYCFTPEWIRFLDNSKRFGEKFEIRLGALEQRIEPAGEK